MSNNEPWWKPAFEVFWRVSAFVVVPIVAALILGKYLDGLYGTRPWIFLGLSCVGFLISSFGIAYTVGQYMNQIEEEKKQENDNPNKAK